MRKRKWRDELIRGDLVYAKLPEIVDSSVQSGIRPCVIVSKDISNRNANIFNICPFTCKNKKKNILVHVHVRKETPGVYLNQD